MIENNSSFNSKARSASNGVDNTKTALLIVDVQNYFINKHTQHIPGNIKNFLENNDFSLICFSQFINSPESNFAKHLNFTGCTKPPYTDIAKELVPWLKEDNTFTKQSFSVFTNPLFENFLQKNKITELAICGLDTEYCVLADCFNAFDRGYKVSVVANCCASFTSGDEAHQSALNIIEKNLGKIL